MDNVDIHDAQELWELEVMLDKARHRINELLSKECELEIILNHEVNQHDIKETMSQKNRFLQLQRVANDDVKLYIDEYIRTQNSITQWKLTFKQLEGKRDSKKKIINILPK